MKKIVLSFFVFLLLTFSFVPYAQAQGAWYNQDVKDWYTKVYDNSNQSEIFGERYTAAQVEWIIWSVLTWLPTKIIGPEAILCAFSGDIGTCVMALFASKETGTLQLASNNEELNLANAIFGTERSLSAITYSKEIARKFHLIPEVKAQNAGFGFNALSSILGMWRASRNIAYALFVLAILVLAFMIMFRVKISPQVVITAQSALPKVIFAIILATFSYAIAGFLVDLMYVVIGILSLFGSQFFTPVLGYAPSSTTIFNFLTLGQPFGLQVQGGIFGLFFLYLFLFVLAFILVVINTLGVIATGFVGAIGFAAGSTLAATGIGTLIGGVLVFIILIVILWMFVKILLGLLRAFATIILLTIFAPLQIALGAVVPDMGFGTWLKSFASNLSVFVVTGALFLLSYAFLFQSVSIAYGEGWGKEILDTILGSAKAEGLEAFSGGAGWPPLLGFGQSSIPLLLLGVSFVLFTIIPQATDIIKSVIERKPFAYGAFGTVRSAWDMTGMPAYQKYIGEKRAQVTVDKLRTGLKRANIPQWLQDILAP